MSESHFRPPTHANIFRLWCGLRVGLGVITPTLGFLGRNPVVSESARKITRLFWSALVSGGVWVGRWGGCGFGGLMGRVGWTVGWFLPVVPHPVVVWEVVVNTDCEMWSHQDGFPGA